MDKRSNKVYKVITGISANSTEDEILNWASYTVIATNALEAITKASKKFEQKGEYALEVEKVIKLDD